VIGISTDTVELQQKFVNKEKLNFPLLADTDQKVTKTFGVLIAGKPMAKRASFVIDREGVIRKIYPQVAKAGDHPTEVLEFVKSNLAKK
jgi:peroxiredoxin Q/BCP